MSGIIREVTIGPCRLIQGDCLDVLPLLSRVDAVDVTITDPPYGVQLGVKKNAQRFNRQEYESTNDSPEAIVPMVRSAIDASLMLTPRLALTPGVKNMFAYQEPDHCGSYFYPAASGCNSWGFSCWQPIFFYGKDPYGGKGSRPDSVMSTESATQNGHPCPKPIEQWIWLVERASRINETVLDPFMGSGTTGVACIRTGRQFIGIEKEPKYFDIAVKRIEREWQLERSKLPMDEEPPQRQKSFEEMFVGSCE